LKLSETQVPSRCFCPDAVVLRLDSSRQRPGVATLRVIGLSRRGHRGREIWSCHASKKIDLLPVCRLAAFAGTRLLAQSDRLTSFVAPQYDPYDGSRKDYPREPAF